MHGENQMDPCRLNEGYAARAMWANVGLQLRRERRSCPRQAKTIRRPLLSSSIRLVGFTPPHRVLGQRFWPLVSLGDKGAKAFGVDAAPARLPATPSRHYDLSLGMILWKAADDLVRKLAGLAVCRC